MTQPDESSEAELRHQLAAAQAQLALIRRVMTLGTFDVVIVGDRPVRVAGDYRQLYGMPPDHGEESYADWLARVHPHDRERVEKTLSAAVEGCSGSYADEYRILQPGVDDVRWIRARADIERDADGRVRRIVGVQIDITQEVQQRERAEDRLRQSEKLKAIGQLTGGIAHDFNNMLQAISGSLGVIGILLQQGRTAEMEAYLDRARRGVTRAAALTHRLLAFGRKQTLAPERLSMDDVVTGMDELIRRTVGPEIKVEMKLNDGDWLILGDVNQMESALLNLCVNARDAMPSGGWLTIATQDRTVTSCEIGDEDDVVPGRYVEVSVSDTGTGMTAETAARAFEPFFTTKAEGRGTGLGLSQIYGFVRQSGGFVRMESTPGEGTAVHLFFPFFATRRGGEPAMMEATILFVEDEAEVRELTIEQFHLTGFRVVEAHSAEAALRVLQTGTHFDVLVSDVRLPGGMDGVQLGETARRLRPSLPIVLISGYSEGRTLAGVPLVDKPFEFATLLEQVQAVLHPPSAPDRRRA